MALVTPSAMNVTFDSIAGQAPISRRAVIPLMLALVGAGWLATCAAAQTAEMVTNLEAVDANGVSTWTPVLPFTLTGVLLTDPGEMLDSTPDYLDWSNGANAYQLGGQWQVFVQTVAPGDRGGVECWMGQNYGNLPWEPHDGSDSYSNEAWSNEVYRVSHDPATGYAFHKGDLVTVTANGALFYGGMENINEEHSTDPAYNFTISLVATNFGLPAPQVISLASVMQPGGNPADATTWPAIFDPTRTRGGEYYQGMRVRINGLTLVTTNGWNTNSTWSARFCTATDGEGRYFRLVHPLYDLGPAPINAFDATGVFLQESGSALQGTNGYELFAQEVAPSDAAILNLTIQNGSVVITWPGSLANYQLQSCDSLAAPNWTAVTNAPAILNGQNTVVLNPAAAQKFFRLQRVQ
jgi:hypothetical protein